MRHIRIQIIRDQPSGCDPRSVDCVQAQYCDMHLIHAYAHTCHTHMHTCMHTYICLYVHIQILHAYRSQIDIMLTCTHTHTYGRIHVLTAQVKYTHVNIHTNIHTHTCTQILDLTQGLAERSAIRSGTSVFNLSNDSTPLTHSYTRMVNTAVIERRTEVSMNAHAYVCVYVYATHA